MSECRLGYSALPTMTMVAGVELAAQTLQLMGLMNAVINTINAMILLPTITFASIFRRSMWLELCQSIKRSSNRRATCQEGQSACQQHLCFCDKMVTDCWAGYPRPVSKKACTHIKPNTTDVPSEVLESDDQTVSSTSSSNNLLDFLVSVWMFIPTPVCPVVNSLLCQTCEGDSCNYPAGSGYLTEICLWGVNYCYKLANSEHRKVYKAGCGYEDCENIQLAAQSKCVTCNYDNCNAYSGYGSQISGGGVVWNGSSTIFGTLHLIFFVLVFVFYTLYVVA
uniref:Uncharacterized protein n=1 Tax=Ditylenchus dipsaci TaxID=166011 RepID=A0A915D9E7_9BILA